VRRLGGRPRRRATTTVATNGNAPVVAPPRDEWLAWLLGAAVVAGVIAVILWLTVFRDNSRRQPGAVVVSARSSVPHLVGINVQAPQAGKRVAQGSTVKLEVSKGPPGVKMPKLIGLAAADAVQRLQALKLGVTLTQTESTEAPGTVVGQDPAAGKRAKPGTKV